MSVQLRHVNAACQSERLAGESVRLFFLVKSRSSARDFSGVFGEQNRPDRFRLSWLVIQGIGGEAMLGQQFGSPVKYGPRTALWIDLNALTGQEVSQRTRFV